MKVRGYITHKAAEKYSDCADYFKICPTSYRIAISDGVSQSTMPLEWARILVNSFVNKEWDPSLDISPLQKKWQSEASLYLVEQKKKGVNNWMLENKLIQRDGAGATFLGLSFEKDIYSAYVLGDSCLVKLGKDFKINQIIASKDGEFNNYPDYFDSYKEKRGNVRTLSGKICNGETILLVSDPFSDLFQEIQNSESEAIVMQRILSITSYEEFLTLIDELRNSFGMQNDDSTLVIIESDESNELNIVDVKDLDFLIKTESLDSSRESNNQQEEIEINENFVDIRELRKLAIELYNEKYKSVFKKLKFNIEEYWDELECFIKNRKKNG